jgi:hypothetical protein
MCLLHDVGTDYWGTDKVVGPYMVGLLQDKVGFFDGAEYIPYWRNDLFTVDVPGVYVSLYRGNGRMIAVVLNARHEEVDVPLTLAPNVLPGGKKVQKLADAETGFVFETPWAKNAAGKQYSGFGEFTTPFVFGIGDRGVRLLVLE